MWAQTNDRFLDRRGCGDELDLDADLKASSVLAGIHGDLFDDVDELYDADDFAAR